MNVTVRNPQYEVKIVTARPGYSYEMHLKASVLNFTTQRRIGQPSGLFQMTLLPEVQPGEVAPGITKTWQDLIGPMDYIELWAWVPPRRKSFPIMRGFVDTVVEEFNIADGRPLRHVIVAGRDYGAFLLITKPYYFNTSATQQVEILKRFLEGFNLLNGWSGEGKPPSPVIEPLKDGELTKDQAFKPAEIQGVIWDKFFLPQLDEIRAFFSDAVPDPVFVPIVDDLEEQLITYSPIHIVANWAPFTDVWTFMRSFQHYPWRELLWQERQDTTQLIYRPTPWLDRDGTFIHAQDANLLATMPTWPIDDTDIIQYQFARSGDHVHNLFFTYPDIFGSLVAFMKDAPTALEGVAVHGNPYLVGENATEESTYRLYGFRQYEVRSPYCNWDLNIKEKDITDVKKDRVNLAAAMNVRMKRAYDHGGALEAGPLVIKGNEQIQIGHYVSLTHTRTKTVNARYYVEGVQHIFRYGTQPGEGQFVTTLTLTRGRGHLQRLGSRG